MWADILIIVAILALIGWVGWRVWRGIAQVPEPETYGDSGGWPTAAQMHQSTKRPTAAEMHGDEGGVPYEVCRQAAQKVTRERVRQTTPAPEIGSGLPAEDQSQ